MYTESAVNNVAVFDSDLVVFAQSGIIQNLN